MQKETAFNDQEIVDFCRATDDTNRIHNPEYMGTLGKRVLVPGMLTFAYAAGLAAEFLVKESNLVEVHFGAPLSSGETVKFSAVEEQPLEVRLSAYKNSEDVLFARRGNHHTRLCQSPVHFYENGGGIKRQFDLDPNAIKTFSEITGLEPNIAGFLFCVAYSSSALRRSIETPQTSSEIDASRMINEGIVPCYHSFFVSMPNGFQEINPDKAVGFTTNLTRVGKRDFTAYASGTQNCQPIYTARFELVMIPEEVIVRKMAKDL